MNLLPQEQIVSYKSRPVEKGRNENCRVASLEGTPIYIAGMGSITLKCNSLHYNYFGKMCHYITLQLLYFVNVINYITITLPK